MDYAHYAINVTGGELPDAELAAYLERGKEKYGKQLIGLDVHLDGEYVELTYHPVSYTHLPRRASRTSIPAFPASPPG